jgi:hypothetical protein
MATLSLFRDFSNFLMHGWERCPPGAFDLAFDFALAGAACGWGGLIRPCPVLRKYYTL